MPIKSLYVAVRRLLSPTKRPCGVVATQSPRQLWSLVSLVVVLLSSCGTQVTTAPLAQIAQKSLPNSSSVQTVTSTSTPETVFVHDSVPLVYALVVPFPTLTDGVSSAELKRAWVEGTAPAPFRGHPLLMTESTLAAIRALWGEPVDSAVRVLPAEQLLETAWSEMPSWAIVPFEVLEPKWKVLTIDGYSRRSI